MEQPQPQVAQGRLSGLEQGNASTVQRFRLSYCQQWHRAAVPPWNVQLLGLSITRSCQRAKPSPAVCPGLPVPHQSLGTSLPGSFLQELCVLQLQASIPLQVVFFK